MRLFGWKSGSGPVRPPLARSMAGWAADGHWPRGYEAQVRDAVLANPVAQRATRLVGESVRSLTLVVSGGPETVTNQGNATAWPVVTVSGDFPGGFRLTSGTRAVEFGFAVFPQSPVVVDMAGSVWVGGAERSHWLRRRDWISVPPQGSASIALDPLAGGTGRAVVAVRDTWL